MRCPHCSSSNIGGRKRRTSLGYRTFSCHDCRRLFNERTAGSFNHLQYPTDIVTLAVLWRLKYKLSLRDAAGFCQGSDHECPASVTLSPDLRERHALPALVTRRTLAVGSAAPPSAIGYSPVMGASER